MPRDARFWRNVAMIAVAHLAVLLALARGGRDTRNANAQSIVWMNSGATEAASNRPSRAAEDDATPAPQIPVAPAKPEEKEESAAPDLAKSEIQLPSPTPLPTPTPKPSVTPSATPTAVPKTSPKPTPKPTPKATPKKTSVAKETPKPSPKKEKAVEKKADAEKKEVVARKDSNSSSNQAADKSSADGNGAGNGSAKNSEFAWYGTMLHDRFHKEWEQPTSVVATGAKMSTLVKIRIEKDGRVSKFTIVKPSGNVVVDESVAAIAQRVTHVDPLPNGLVKGAYYVVQINFELNPEK